MNSDTAPAPICRVLETPQLQEGLRHHWSGEEGRHQGAWEAT